MLAVRRATALHRWKYQANTSNIRSRSFAAVGNNKQNSNKWCIAFWYPAVGGLMVVTTAGVYTYNHMGGMEGLSRTISFYSLAIPKYVQYRWHQWNDSEDHVWEELDRDTSSQGLNKILELKGFYIKCGQLCASNIGNAFPRVWQDTMAVLQDQVPPQPFETIRDIIKSELDYDKVFASFEKEPIGAASIGQVHRATLHDGTPVVVKVCYPDVERLLRGDVRTVKFFAQVAQPVHVPALEEIEHQFMTEFDYVQEAAQMGQVRDNLIKAGLAGPGKLCVVPRPFHEYCTKRVLVMEELKGDKLVDGLRKEVKVQAARMGQTVEVFQQEQRAKEQEAKEAGQELQGPTAKEFRTYISLLEGRRRLINSLKAIYNAGVGWIPGVQRKQMEDKSNLPINHAQMIDDLIYIHGHQVLVDGCFNGDPHPGNLLLVRSQDGSPQLGLIDFGQVKQLSKETRHRFCRLIIALAEDNREEIIRLTKEAGFKSKRMDPDVIYLYAKVGYDLDNDELLDGLHIQMFMEELERRDPIIELPKELLMVSRASIIIRGLAHALHQSRSMAQAWKPIAERVLQEEA